MFSKRTETLAASVFMGEENVQCTGKQAHKVCPLVHMCTSQDRPLSDRSKIHLRSCSLYMNGRIIPLLDKRQLAGIVEVRIRSEGDDLC
jgi:hypothetical protein